MQTKIRSHHSLGSYLTKPKTARIKPLVIMRGYRGTWEPWEAPGAESLRRHVGTSTGQTRNFSLYQLLSGQTPAVTCIISPPGVITCITISGWGHSQGYVCRVEWQGAGPASLCFHREDSCQLLCTHAAHRKPGSKRAPHPHLGKNLWEESGPPTLGLQLAH